MKLSRASKVTASSLILLSLFGGSFSANAGQNPERAAERAQVRAAVGGQLPVHKGEKGLAVVTVAVRETELQGLGGKTERCVKRIGLLAL